MKDAERLAVLYGLRAHMASESVQDVRQVPVSAYSMAAEPESEFRAACSGLSSAELVDALDQVGLGLLLVARLSVNDVPLLHVMRLTSQGCEAGDRRRGDQADDRGQDSKKYERHQHDDGRVEHFLAPGPHHAGELAANANKVAAEAGEHARLGRLARLARRLLGL